MEQKTFAEQLALEGFTELATVDREPGGFLDLHTHPFEAKALILEGEIRLYLDDGEKVYAPGSIFHLQANQPHAERYGAQGVKYLVGRK